MRYVEWLVYIDGQAIRSESVGTNINCSPINTNQPLTILHSNYYCLLLLLLLLLVLLSINDNK